MGLEWSLWDDVVVLTPQVRAERPLHQRPVHARGHLYGELRRGALRSGLASGLPARLRLRSPARNGPPQRHGKQSALIVEPTVLIKPRSRSTGLRMSREQMPRLAPPTECSVCTLCS